MAPEQIRGTPAVSHKTDLYALGIVLYQMLVGQPPFEGTSAGRADALPHERAAAAGPATRSQEIPKALDDLVVALMAKEPADRPWDAAAVEHVLTELRDKAERGAAVPMVWPTPGSAAANPPRAGAPTGAGGARADSTATDRPRRKPRKAGVFSTLSSTLFATRSRSQTDESGSPLLSRGVLEIVGLLLALVAVGGLIVYLVWPLGQEALYQKAETLMASTHRADWLTARDEYLEPLDRRFPDHPYREQTQKWRDKILLDEVEGRAAFLASPTDGPFKEPRNKAENLFVVAYNGATAASKVHEDPVAVEQWKKLAGQLDSDDPEERKWYLLALHRAEQVENAIRNRRQLIQNQLQMADEAFVSGHPEQANAIRKELVDQYAGYPYLKDLLPAVPSLGPSPTDPYASAVGLAPGPAQRRHQE